MTSSEPIPKAEREPNKEVFDDNARKFIVDSFNEALLEAEETSYLLITDWLEMGNNSEKKLAYKKYPNKEPQILLISKQRTEQGRISEKPQINEAEYKQLLDGAIRHVEKVRHELTYIQGDIWFELKYDEFAGSELRVLEVDANTDEERASFDPGNFPGKLIEVTGDSRYEGYRIGDVLNS